MPADILYLVLVCAATIFGFWISLWLISLAINDSSIGDPLTRSAWPSPPACSTWFAEL